METPVLSILFIVTLFLLLCVVVLNNRLLRENADLRERLNTSEIDLQESRRQMKKAMTTLKNGSEQLQSAMDLIKDLQHETTRITPGSNRDRV